MSGIKDKTIDIGMLKNRQRILHAVQQWKQVLDNSPDMVAILDNNRQVILLNQTACVRLGVPQEQAAGKDYCTLLHQGNGRHPDCPHSRLERSGEWQSCKESITILGKPFRISVSPLMGDAGEIIATVHVAREVC